MKVFVTGHRGYIGVHLVELLQKSGHQVVGCDINLFEGCAWLVFAVLVIGIFAVAMFGLGFVRQIFIEQSDDPVFTGKT